MNSKIGSISACIAGDFRYSSCIEVYVNNELKCAYVRLLGNVTCMSPVATIPLGLELELDCKIDPNDIVKVIKRLIDFPPNGCPIIHKYGKPYKNFEWKTTNGVLFGLNERNCKAAIDAVFA